ncbi:uncharacterized protein FFMR_08831 [Fusarium fujikuroi]|nr:uncharacterized protein FFMR_08831 [Fusarium fujikuroi]
MKSGEDRNRIAAAEGIIAFKIEGAGVWDVFPSIVIKGACNYADSHKSKAWQRYSAATAAACAKAFLSFWTPSITQGRDNILERLQSLFFVEDRQKVALVGLGGIGKTQVALQLAYWIQEKKQDYSVFWVPALSRASFEQAYMQIMNACGVPTSETDSVVESVRRYLSSKDAGKWLLVVDNADDEQAFMGPTGVENRIYQCLPKSDQGLILFTTRYRKLAVAVAGRNILEVSTITQDKGRSYLKKALIQEISSSDEQVMDHLLMLLTHLPLAIIQAASYLNENQISLAEYIQLFESTDRDRTELLHAKFQDDTRYDQSQHPVATTWFISFNQILQDPEG